MVHADWRARHDARLAECYFLSTVTHDRTPVFSDFAAARLAIGEMRRMHDLALVASLAWAVMPDGVHWLLALGHCHSIDIVARLLKTRTAAALTRHGQGRGPLWQRHSEERAVGTHEDLATLARWLVASPLRAGLVSSLRDYPHWDAVWLA